jgi:hypothetical protein
MRRSMGTYQGMPHCLTGARTQIKECLIASWMARKRTPPSRMKTPWRLPSGLGEARIVAFFFWLYLAGGQNITEHEGPIYGRRIGSGCPILHVIMTLPPGLGEARIVAFFLWL